MAPTLLVLGDDPFLPPVLDWARAAGLEVVQTGGTARRRATHEFHHLPADSVEGHVDLARRLVRANRLAGVLAVEPATRALLGALSDAAPGLLPPRRSLATLASPEDTRAWLRDSGFERADDADAEGRRFEAFAFLREGAFVPAGLAEETRLESAESAVAGGDVLRVLPARLDPGAERAAWVCVERAARALGFTQGPLQATLVETRGRLALEALAPGFPDLLGATHGAALAFERSPFQAWFAHLAGAGGPFDELPLAPHASAGWLALVPDRAGLYAGVDGQLRARAAGLAGLWIEEPGRRLVSPELPQAPLGWLWAEGVDREQVEQRLRTARALLEPRIATRQRVA